MCIQRQITWSQCIPSSSQVWIYTCEQNTTERCENGTKNCSHSHETICHPQCARNKGKHNVGWNVIIFLFYGKTNQAIGPALRLVLTLLGLCSTDHFHGNGPSRVLLLWSKAGKFKIGYQNSEKKMNIVILNSKTTRKSLKDWDFTKISKMDEDKHSPSAFYYPSRAFYSQKPTAI